MTVVDEVLRAELLRRMKRDQAARLAEDSDGYSEVDAENLPWLKRLVAERGWPGSSLVGVDGARFVGPVVAARLKCSECDAWTPFEPPAVDETVTVTGTGCGREMMITGPPPRLPGQGPPLRCPGCAAWMPFAPPAPGESVTITCPECGRRTTALFKG